MTFALDTNIISYILRGDKQLKEHIKQEEHKGNDYVIPLMVYYEVRRGLLANGSTTKMGLFHNLCLNLGINDLTKEDMKTAAAIYADRKHKGKPIDDGDLLIAAQCITNGYTLITHNTKHFQGIDDLTIEDWCE